MGEPGALRVLPAKLLGNYQLGEERNHHDLTLLRGVGVSVVVDDVVLGEVAGALNKVPTY